MTRDGDNVMYVGMQPNPVPFVVSGTAAWLVELDWLRERIAELEAANAELRLNNDALYERIVQLEERQP